MKSGLNSPRLAGWLFNRFIPPEDRNYFIADIEEVYSILTAEKGYIKAVLWYWMQLFRSLPSFLSYLFTGGFAMLRNYILIAFRNIKRNKIYSFINIAGLSVGMACFLLIALYVQYEFSFDRFNDNYDRIYRVIMEQPKERMGKKLYATTPGAAGPAIESEIPEVVSASRFTETSEVMVSIKNNSYSENNGFYTDPGTLTIFTLPLISGNQETALNDPYSIVLSKKTAEKYFGEEEPVGKIIKMKFGQTDHYVDLMVTGVMKNIPENSHFKTDFFLSYKTLASIKNKNLDVWYGIAGYTYCLLRQDTDPNEVESKFKALLHKYLYKNKEVSDKSRSKLLLQPLKRIHLYSDINFDMINKNSASINYIYLFSLIAFLVLLIACVNYINLVTARSTQRGKEIVVRKVVGAHKKQLVKQFLGESIVLTVLAFTISIIIVLSVLPAYNSFVERELSFNLIKNVKFIPWIISLLLFTGAAAGSYPALYISSFSPVKILKGALKSSSKSTLIRNSLVLLQFSISIILISCALIVKNQLKFIKNKDLGYSRGQIIILNTSDSETFNNLALIKNKIQKSPDIIHVSSSSSLPNNIQYQNMANWPGKPKDQRLRIFLSIVDYDYIDLFGMNIIEGRKFSKDFPSDGNGAFILNESAVKALGWNNPLEKELTHWNGKTGKVVGVVKDFHFHSLHRKIIPLYLYLNPDRNNYYLSIKITGSRIPETINFLRDTFAEYSPNYPFQYTFFDEVFDKAYRAEQRMDTIFSFFAFIAIVIACLGLFGLAAFTVGQRTKEIGIRKVLGASSSSIFFLLSKEFTKWVLLANIIAWPIAWYAMNRWLQNFAYKTGLGIDIFIFASLAVLFIALLTISFQSVKASGSNPADSLKYE